MMYCDNCKAEFSDDIIYCKWCGQLLRQRRAMTTTQLSKCFVCSAPMHAGWTFCNSCGAQFDAPPPASAGPVCMRCGAVVQPGAPTCQRCGERLTIERDSPLRSGPAAATTIIRTCATCDEPLEANVMYCKACGAPVSPPAEETEESRRSTQSYASFIPDQEPPRAADRLLSAELPPLPTPVDAGKETQVVASPFLQPDDDASPAVGTRTEFFATPTDRIADPDNATFELTPEKVTAPVENETKPSTRAEIKDLLASSNAFEPGSESSTPPEAEHLLPPRPATDEYDSYRRPSAEGGGGEAMTEGADEALDKTRPFPRVTGSGTKNHAGIITSADLEEGPDEPPAAASTQIYPMPPPPPPDTGTKEFSFDSLPFETTTHEPPPDLASDQAARKPADDTRFQTQLHAPFTPPPEAPPPVPTYAPTTDVQSPFPPPTAAPAKRSSLAILLPVLFVLLAAGAVAVWWFTSGPANVANTNTATANTNTPSANTNTATANANTARATPAPPEGMVLVEAGTYPIGREDGDDIEKPKHTVPLKAYFIDRTEVTNREYKRFVDATKYQPPPDWTNGTFKEGQANFPVVNVSWRDAVAYASWAGKRLPTEDEWEAAARGTAGNKYPWGNDWQAGLANVGSGGTTEVGKHPNGKSPAGALDLIGNVWEWTADTFKLYPGSTAQMPAAIEPGISYRVIRGGAFDGSRQIDASYRGFAEETRRDLSKTGFRCAKDAP